ncbi:glycoside hydrolase superfamily [Aspergillus egyptiacus]|nr:glycoside hydrolase superfamily [Aspergillus egyptiacus]
MKWTTLSLTSLLALPLAIANPTSYPPTIQIGQHVIFSYPGTTPPEQLYTLIHEGKVGGLILFTENVHDDLPATIADLQTRYRLSPAYLGTPLLIMTDQEGGSIRRLPGGPEPSAKEVGSSSDPGTLAAETGLQAAEELLKYHMNSNLAPVLDVYRESGDFTDQWGRSYSQDPEVVANCSTRFLNSQQGEGVLATAKHFPGLGVAAAEENTDERPVTITAALETIREVDEAPYGDAIEAGVAMIMPSWAVYPALDAERPAGMSERWIRGELRERLGYQGVVVTDAIEAGSLEGFGDHANRGLLAKLAGVDILLASGRNVTQGEAIVNRLVEALDSGELVQEDLDVSSERVRKMRELLL